ncbi:hypothetical protein HY745_06660 [Candidatus Desantisbacteria bacterium]|nr:hypothetical protein [Candidatus Desantisbacteria bacterium]
MPTDKERFEILLEHVISKIDVVAEGHGILVNKIDTLDRKVDDTRTELVNMIMTSNKVLHEKIDNVEMKLTEKIDNVKIELNEKIDNVETRLNEKIDNVEMKLTEKIDNVKIELNEKIDNVETKLSEKIDNIDKRLINVEKKVDRIEPLEKKVDKINDTLSYVLKRQDAQEEKTDKIYRKVFVN